MKETMNDVLVLKIGTSTLVKDEELDHESFERIGQQVNELRRNNHDVVLVTSSTRNRLSHVRWSQVVETWNEAIDGETEDFLLTERELDWQGGCEQLTAASLAGKVAIVNANDAELGSDSPYRSNDIVGARLALHLAATGRSVQYGMLSDVHGVLTDVAASDSTIATIHDIGANRHLAGGVGSVGASGGMATKFTAAEMTTGDGIETWIAHGRTDNVIDLAMTGRVGTMFSCRVRQSQAV